MASVKFNKKKFEKEIGKLTEEMQNKIALFGTTVESVSENEVELDITPNRPEFLSYENYKRDFLNFLSKGKGLKKYKVNKPAKNYEVKMDSSVKSVRPYTACAIVRGLKLDDEKIKEIIDLQEKLHSTVGRRRKKAAIGIYPMDNISLPINYKALEPFKINFKPLEYPRELNGLEILQKHPTGKEYSHLLAGKEKFPIFEDSQGKILSMPPIINSEDMGRVNVKTKDVFVECSGFDEEILSKTLNIVLTTLAEMKGEIYSMKVGKKVYPNFEFQKVKLSKDNVNKILGLNLNEKEIRNLLSRMGHEYEKGIVSIASWRTDVLGEIDLIEDVAIAYGYDNFEAEIAEISSFGKENDFEVIKRKISEILIGFGYLEISNYHLTKESDQITKMGYSEKNDFDLIELMDSKTEYNFLRKDLAHYLLKIFSENVDREYPQKIFEIGSVFNFKEGKIEEQENLSLGLSSGNFTDVRQILDGLANSFNLKLEFREGEKIEPYFIEGRCAQIVLEGEVIGLAGEISPKVLRNFKCKMPVALFEINLEKLVKRIK